MARRFPDPKDAETANILARTHLLVGDDLGEVKSNRLVKLAKFATDSKPDNRNYRETYGAALYRAGQFKAAVEQLTPAVEKRGEDGTIWQQSFLAMTQHRLGNRTEARDWLTRAARQIEARSKGRRPAWYEQVEWHHLRAEAEATLRWHVPPQK
jgi:predicted Zn-dependent protease